MPLGLFVPLVVIGIAGIVFLVHRLGWSRPLMLQTPLDVERVWVDRFPDDTVVDTMIDDAGRVALVRTARGQTGLAWSLGADAVVRLAEDVSDSREAPPGLHLRLRDYTAPRVIVTLAAREARADWLAALDLEESTP